MVVQILSGIHLKELFFSIKRKTLPNWDLNSGPFIKNFTKHLLYYLSYIISLLFFTFVLSIHKVESNKNNLAGSKPNFFK